MDLGRPLSTRDAVPVLDHAVLVAAHAVRQAGTRTAREAARLDAGPARPERWRALAAVLLLGDAGAARVLDGSFHARVARGTAPSSTLVKPGFTVAF